MKQPQAQDITRLLLDWGDGNRAALDELMPLVYDELRRMAKNRLRAQSADHTLQPTALVNEAYLRLIDSSRVQWQNRAHFFAISAQLMRRVLVDSVRSKNSLKRGGEFEKTELDESVIVCDGRTTDLVALDEALKNLARLSERQSRVVELRYFGGLTETEIAAALGVTERTVRRDWTAARAWLYKTLKDEG